MNIRLYIYFHANHEKDLKTKNVTISDSGLQMNKNIM